MVITTTLTELSTQSLNSVAYLIFILPLLVCIRLQFSGENFIRSSGDVKTFAQTQSKFYFQ